MTEQTPAASNGNDVNQVECQQKTSPFMLVESIDIHKRRQQIIKEFPEIRKLYVTDINTFYTGVTVWIVQFILGYLVELHQISYFQCFLLIYIVGAPLTHWLGQCVHESSHDLIFKTKTFHPIFDLFCNLPMIIPIAATFRRYHIPHHTYLGVINEDNHNIYYDTDLPLEIEAKYISNSRILKLLWIILYASVYLVRGFSLCIDDLNRLEWINLISQLSFNYYMHIVSYGLCYLFFSMIIGHNFHPVAAHFIHER